MTQTKVVASKHAASKKFESIKEQEDSIMKKFLINLKTNGLDVQSTIPKDIKFFVENFSQKLLTRYKSKFEAKTVIMRSNAHFTANYYFLPFRFTTVSARMLIRFLLNGFTAQSNPVRYDKSWHVPHFEAIRDSFGVNLIVNNPVQFFDTQAISILVYNIIANTSILYNMTEFTMNQLRDVHNEFAAQLQSRQKLLSDKQHFGFGFKQN